MDVHALGTKKGEGPWYETRMCIRLADIQYTAGKSLNGNLVIPIRCCRTTRS